ncbi:unnamed protein product [Chrysoparadoxa australica]
MNKPVMVKGHRLRDEFACPITRELMRDPVIAADGHTYDREAIEMWTRNHTTSPKTGEFMDHLMLVPNLNLKRLIKDLIEEGGEGLYMKEEDGEDGPDTPYRFALVAEHVLILKCLGPVESDWNWRSFRVTERGCIGGRKQPSDLGQQDFMHFSDATVSRRHFEISFDKKERKFSLRDFGSAGGTFVRVPFGVPKPLYPGIMVMLGKHQLVARATEKKEEAQLVPEGDEGEPSKGEEGLAEGVVGGVEKLQLQGEGKSRVKLDDDDEASVPDMPAVSVQAPGVEGGEAEGGEGAGAVVKSVAASVGVGSVASPVQSFSADLKLAADHSQLELACFAPEGTPIQGNKYYVGKQGSSLGRKQSNSIAFSHEVNGTVMGIDSSISGEHARITYDAEHDCLQIMDGTETKPSTNGTWFRLSQMHKESDPFVLQNGSEILIGTVRFVVTLESMIVERDADEYNKQQAAGETANTS